MVWGVMIMPIECAFDLRWQNRMSDVSNSKEMYFFFFNDAPLKTKHKQIKREEKNTNIKHTQTNKQKTHKQTN